jgi:hypothetical protein
LKTYVVQMSAGTPIRLAGILLILRNFNSRIPAEHSKTVDDRFRLYILKLVIVSYIIRAVDSVVK